MLQSNIDPFLFIGDKFICIVFFYELIFWAKGDSEMHDLAMKLCDIGVDIEQ